MKSVRVLALGLSVLMGLSVVGSAFAHERGKWVNRREAREHHRLEQGIHHGQLTRQEAHKLAKEQYRVKKYERVARADGHISPKEAHKLQRMQNHESRDIYKQKHDNQHRH